MDRYLKIIKKYENDIPYLAGINLDYATELERITNRVTAPVMVSYVWWVLTEAQKKNINTLYFLARDGYTLYEIAKLFCENFEIKIDCRYLYCSRAALRMPTYHFIGEEAYQLLLLGGSYNTPEHILDRIDCSESERNMIYRETGFDCVEKNTILSKNMFNQFCEQLKKSSTYKNVFMKKSKDSYSATEGYFKQEGLFETNHVAIVDTGWTGSMQRSLRQILEHAGHTPEITGFYFGMYVDAKEKKDGQYLTWYFNSEGPDINRIMFCNNLLECMLSAPHGMTTGYKKENSGYIPVQKAAPTGRQLEDTILQNKIILEFARKVLEKINYFDFHQEQHLKLTKELLKSLMAYPEKKEVQAYQNFLFCDDITEKYQMELCNNKYDISRYLIYKRVYRKILNRKINDPVQQPEALWIYASIAFLPTHKQWWYRTNIVVWEWLKCILKKR